MIPRDARARGFTILEMVIVVVLLAITAITVGGMVAQLSSHQTDNTDLQVGTQILQECGEWIVSNHRRDENFFTSSLTTSPNCYSVFTTTHDGWSAPTVTVTTYTGTGCPTGATCKLATISNSKSGAALNDLHLVLVRYNPL
jgi:prepilin-type N-terminal cleavage/methylation domain-containing protein